MIVLDYLSRSLFKQNHYKRWEKNLKNIIENLYLHEWIMYLPQHSFVSY